MKSWHLIVLLLAIVAFQARIEWPLRIPDQQPGLQIKSPPYRWSATCPTNFEFDHDRVMRGCSRPEYEIADYVAAGLREPGRRRRHWYRIGDDAYELSCHSSYCFVYAEVRDRFAR